jgi:hypothetical protein
VTFVPNTGFVFYSTFMPIPAGGNLPGDGLIPTLIAWDADSSHRCDPLEPNDCNLVRLEGTHPKVDRIARGLSELRLEGLIGLALGPVSLRASLQIGSEIRCLSD